MNTFKSKLYKFINYPYFGLILILLIAIIVSIQNYSLGENKFWEGTYTHYNNFVIFKQSFFHLLDHKNIYLLYPEEHGDHFKYSPSFALFIGSLAWLPDLPGLILWNLLNCIVFYLAIKKIKNLSSLNFLFILGFVVLDLVLSTMASQSNLLVAGLMILAFNKLEEQKPGTAALLIVAGVFIKLFAILAALLFIFYPKKLQFVLYTMLWSLVVFAAPLFLISFQELTWQYSNWLGLLNQDHDRSTGTSIFTIFSTLFGTVNKNLTLAGGFILLLLPVFKYKLWENYAFRAWYLSAMLIWIVVFNHKGESPTYVIALTGCAIWGVFTNPSLPVKILLALTWVFSSFVKTDLFSKDIKKMLHLDFTNALFPSVIFLVIIVSMLYKLKWARLKDSSDQP